MLRDLLRSWREKRAEAAAQRQRVEGLFESFLNETRPFVRRAPKHPLATLYRHAWKRAAVLEILYQRTSDEAHASLYRAFRELAGERYSGVAPVGPYGPVRLRMEPKAAIRLLQKEAARMLPTQVQQRPLACIYIGRDEEGRVYVGQTVEAPEHRWIQHRAGGTGPFKKGAQYIEWRVIEGPVQPTKLDELESYNIGLYEAYERGHNDSRGNDWRAYDRGCADRRRTKSRVSDN